jgi:ABC-type transport system involved in multi-copper enzyme maturation permease subunit
VSRLINAELMKLRTTRATFWILGVLGAAIVLIVLLLGLLLHAEHLQSRDNQQGLLGVGIAVPLATLIIGIIISSGEFRHGTITPTLLATPQRARVVAAKLVAGALFGMVLLVVGEGLALALGGFALAVRGIPVHLYGGDLPQILGSLVVACGLWGAFGAALGTAFRNQSATLIVSILWVLIAENILRGFFPGQASFLPGSALIGVLSRNGGEGLLHLWPALVVSCAYVVLSGVAAWQLLERRDVS